MGWMSAVGISASERTRARPTGSAGNIGGLGCVSSRYSRIAIDWVSTSPESSTKAGTSFCGLMAT